MVEGMTNGPQPRRHHYVPRCWLSGFSQGGTNSGRLWVTDFARQKQWPSSPDNSGHIRDLYRLSEPTLDPVAVEKFFGDLETEKAPLLKKLDAERRGPDDSELDSVLEFMAYQVVRVPSFRKIVLDITERSTSQVLAKFLHCPDTWTAALEERNIDPTVPAASYEEAMQIFESGDWNVAKRTDWFILWALREVSHIHGRLRERYWHTSISPKGRLIASDTPVVLDGERDQLIGFRNAELIFYPVSRHVLIVGSKAPLKEPQQNLRFFAGWNTMALLRAEAQVYSHEPDFVWLDAAGKVRDDWRAFTKGNL